MSHFICCLEFNWFYSLCLTGSLYLSILVKGVVLIKLLLLLFNQKLSLINSFFIYNFLFFFCLCSDPVSLWLWLNFHVHVLYLHFVLLYSHTHTICFCIGEFINHGDLYKGDKNTATTLNSCRAGRRTPEAVVKSLTANPQPDQQQKHTTNPP